MLTRDEIAKLLWLCYRSKGNDKRGHLVRVVLIAVYTGTRHDALLRLQWIANTAGGYADRETARLYRRPSLPTETKKGTPTIRIPDRLLTHMRRWRDENQGILPIMH